MLAIVVLLTCFLASTAGTMVGFGGGVIIKPVLDLLGVMPVATVSFLSGCTVLCMAAFSLVYSRKSPVKLKLGISVPLAIGATVGGIIGKWMFEMVRTGFESQNVLGGVQAICLTVITCLVFVYILFKDRLPSYEVESKLVALVIGVVLGIISAFLGIGGGTSNVAVLFFFFSMDAKTTAKNSLFIILFSQAANILLSVFGGTVPDFSWLWLLLMVAGTIGGSLLGGVLFKKLSVKQVETMLRILLVLIICIDFTNVIRFCVL